MIVRKLILLKMQKKLSSFLKLVMKFWGQIQVNKKLINIGKKNAVTMKKRAIK